MQSDADSIYAYAVAYGYTGGQLSATDYMTYKSWVYLDGAVSSYTVFTLASETCPFANCHTIQGTRAAVAALSREA